MAMAFLRTENGLIDLRQPLTISIDLENAAVRVMPGMSEFGAGGQIVARAEREDGLSGLKISHQMTSRDGEKYIPVLRPIADSLAHAISYASSVCSNSQDSTAWILSFEPDGKNSWTMHKAAEIPGFQPVFHLR